MQNLLGSMSDYFAKVPDQVRNQKWLVWLFFAVVTAVCFAGIERTRFDMTVEGWFERDDPTIVAFDWFHQDFGSEDHLYLVYKPKDGDVFSDESLAAVKGIREDLLSRMRQANREGKETALNHIVKITSVVNAPVIRAEGDVLVSQKLIPDALPLSEARRQQIIEIGYDQKQFPKMYFSEDHKYGGIFIETDFGAIPLNADDEEVFEAEAAADFELDLTVEDDLFEETAVATERPEFKPTDLEDYLALMEAIKVTLNDPKYADKFEYYPVGNTAMTEYDLAVMEEMGMLIFATFIIIAALLWFLFRSFSAVLWPVVIVILSVIWTIGITGWLGLSVTSFIMITVLLTLAIGVADAVHIMAGYLSGRKQDMSYEEAMRHSFKTKSVACLLTAVTTIVGMMALSFTDIVPVKTFGFMSALAVGLAFIFSIYLLPLMMDIWAPNKTKAPKDNAQGMGKIIPNLARFSGDQLDKVLPMVERRPVTIVAIFMTIFAVCIYGATLTKVDTNPIGQYPVDSPARENFRIVDSKMMGTQSMEIYLDMGKMNAFQDPFVLKAMDELQQKFIRDYEPVVRATSMVGVAKNAFKTLNGGDESFYRIPDEPGLLSQTLFLFNNAAPEDRARLVSDNYDRAHITVRMLNAGSYEYINVFDDMRKDIYNMLETLKTRYPDAKVDITGMLALMMQGAQYLTHAQLQSFSLALVFISVILLIVFGSIRAGTIAIIPNLIPAVMAFGLLGLFGMPLDFTAMMIAPVIIGIAVDDTVHFVTRYRLEVSIDGDIKRALATTIKETGQAIVFTAIILGLGFGIMGLSGSEGTANIGRLGGLAILMGLLNDLFLLPAMILIFKLKFNQQGSQTQTLGLSAK